MTSSHSNPLALSRALRHHDSQSTQPQTPEPFAEHDDMQRPPSPPRPRFKLKRRVASNLNAPTEQFLASVAAADVPIPSIEEPHATADDLMNDMAHNIRGEHHLLDDRSVPRGRTLSPPRTPAPGSAPSLSPKRYPDWSIDAYCSSIESTPDCESSRPSTAVSTQTSASLFSRYSITSEDLQCIAMDTTEMDSVVKSADEDSRLGFSKSNGKRRRAQWTRPMSDHLWSTYLAYVEDPKVTPIRFSKSGIPPHGVCARVARQAKKTWRGSNKSTDNHVASASGKSGSATPTAESPPIFVQWPHTDAAARAHLRALCKLRVTSSTTRATQYATRFATHTPTPFGRTAARLRMRRTTPTPFSSKELCMSLALSTCDSMQPSGPLAQLTQATPEPMASRPPAEASSFSLDSPTIGRRRLASPFTARSYGPSSTDALGAALALGPQRQTHTMGAQCTLQSPARLSRSSTQKRRSRQSSLEPRRTKRPSLGSDLWVRPSTPPGPARVESIQTNPLTTFSSSSNTCDDELFVPRTNLLELFSTSPTGPRAAAPSGPLGPGFGPVESQPGRLGSPFSSTTSFSFPSRLIKGEPLSLGSTIRPFATAHRQNETSAVPTRDLDGRMAYLDQRLREIRSREANRRRSESPF